MTGMD